jgi:hypothetical protein
MELIDCVLNNKWIQVMDILENKADTITDGRIIAFIMNKACEKGKLKVIQALLKHPSINQIIKNDGFIRASSDNRVAAMQLLFDSGADPSANNNAAIRFAAVHHDTDAVSLLLRLPGVDPCAQDNEMWRRALEDGPCAQELRDLLRLDPRIDTSDNRPYYYWQ